MFILENSNVVWKMVAILSRPQCATAVNIDVYVS